MNESAKLLLTVSEASERLGVGRSFLWPYVSRGELPSVKLGRSRRIPVKALEEFVQRLAESSRG